MNSHRIITSTQNSSQIIIQDGDKTGDQTKHYELTPSQAHENNRNADESANIKKERLFNRSYDAHSPSKNHL